jgi:gliding motility-associated-like protein
MIKIAFQLGYLTTNKLFMKKHFVSLLLFAGLCSWFLAPCLVSAQVPSYVPTSGLVGWWPFSGNANDESGNGYNGVVSGATLTTDRNGNVNSAYNFNGTSSFISLSGTGSLDFSQGATFAAWINSNDLRMASIVDKEYGCNSYGYRLNIRSNGDIWTEHGCYGAAQPGALGAVAISGYSANTWVHVVGTLDPINGKNTIYINGNLVSSVNITQMISNTKTIEIGRVYSPVTYEFFEGKIDDVSIWNRALTECEIQRLYLASNYSPPVSAGTDQQVCSGTSVTLTGSGAITYTWDNGITDNTPFTASATTTYTITGTDTYGCTATDQVNVVVTPVTSSSISPTICNTYTAPDGTVYTSSGNYTAVIPNAAGCDSTITINLTVNNATSSSISPTVCNTYTAPDGAVYTSSGNYTAVIPNAAGCDSTITINLTVKNATSSTISPTVCNTYTAPDGAVHTTSGTYTAVIPNASGCDSTITINLTVNDSPNVNAGADQLVCEGTEVTLTASGATTYSWSNGITNGIPFTPAAGTANYTVTGTDANGCEGSDNVLVTVTTPPSLNLVATSPECPGESTGSAEALVTGGTAPYSFLWNNGIVSGLNSDIPAGTYSVTLTDNAGCTQTGTVIVTDATEPCFFIPGGLSPNADGNNDSWAVNGLNAYPEAKVMVYNRWGQLLYDAGPDDAPWDGTYLGEELPTADYYYIIDLGNGETFNGVITLKR